MPKSPTKTSPKSSPKKKGILLSDKPEEIEAKALANKRAEELGTKCKEIRKYASGVIGVYFENGKFQFIRGATKEYLEKARAKRGSKSKSPSRKSQSGGKSDDMSKFYKKQNKQKGGDDMSDEMDMDMELKKMGRRRRSQRAGNQQQKKKVSLKTAVRLLRQYYSEKYDQ